MKNQPKSRLSIFSTGIRQFIDFFLKIERLQFIGKMEAVRLKAMATSFNLNIKIKQLENSNKTLEQNLKTLIQTLAQQHNTLRALSDTNKLGSAFIQNQLNKSHREMHQLTSKQLLTSQIQVQQQGEIKEIIKSYQKKMAELQNSLAVKENQIVYETYQEKRENAPRRQNLRLLNHQCLEKHFIKKGLKELKKLKVEIQSLEFMSNKKGTFFKQSQFYLQRQIVKVKNKMNIQKTLTNEQKDKMLQKMMYIVQKESAKEKQLKNQIHNLRCQWQQTTKINHSLIKKYTKLHKNKRIDTENIDDQIQTSKQMNFLELLQQQIKPKDNNKLFVVHDMNKQQRKQKVQTKSLKGKSRETKCTKQNDGLYV